MAKKNLELEEAQKFVRDVLAKHFKQTVRGEPLRNTARKVLEAVSASHEPTKKAA